MVMPQYANLKIDFWLHRGRLGFSEPSLCLFHESTQFGTPILDAVNELQFGACPTQRTLTFASHQRDLALSTLRLIYVAEREELRIMAIRQIADKATIEVTAGGLKLLSNAIAAWLGGAEDFGVCPRHSNLNPKEFGGLDRSSGEL